MFKLLKSDFYRLFRSKSFYICGVIAVALFVLSLVAAYFSNKLMSDQGSEIASLLNFDGLQYGIRAFADMDNQIILSIVLGIFVTSEFAHGTMKNVVSKGFSRVSIYFSKLITMVAASYIIIFVTMITGVIGGTIVTGKFNDLSSGHYTEYLKTIGVELLLYAAFSAVLVFIGMLVRNLGGVIAINIIGVTMFIPIVCNILQAISRDKIKFTYASLADNMGIYITKVEPAAYLRSVIVAVVYFAVATGLGILAFTKTDVK